MDKLNSKQVKAILDKTEKYIKSTIEKDFPLKVEQFLDYDNDDSSMWGLILADNGKKYNFLIEKEDGIPMLKPFTGK